MAIPLPAAGQSSQPSTSSNWGDELTPKQIVVELDRYIVGQSKAKRAVAVALRNRYRRERLSANLRDEVIPKNILMIGPTGVGKTEIARRLAKLADAPFLKVEATKFTEVGYVGRDVESMIRDLVESAIRMVEKERMEAVKTRADELALDRLVHILRPRPASPNSSNPITALFGGSIPGRQNQGQPEEMSEKDRSEFEELRRLLQSGVMDDKTVEIDIEEQSGPGVQIFSNQNLEDMGNNLQEMLGGILPGKKRKRNVTIGEARKLLAQEEAKKLIDNYEVKREAVRRVERRGIVFLDEIDKIAGREKGSGPDVSREGVQRDLLPLIEGSTVNTKHGPVKTDHILFIAAGAFHMSKPSDLIPELQGRFPIRVELESLTPEDFVRILSEPENALTRQYRELLATEGLEIEFPESGIRELARVAVQLNEQTENIGARRLHTIIERVLESVAFEAPDIDEKKIVVDEDYVRGQLSAILEDRDLSRYIL